MNLKILKSILIGAIIISVPLIVFAQPTQDASVVIAPGSIFSLDSPDNFSFDPIFTDNLSTISIYKTLDPTIASSLLIIEDADTSGLNFQVTLTMDNMFDGTSIIPFTSLSVVTLASDPWGVDIATTSTHLPISTAGVTAPLACLGWAGNLTADCSTELNLNYLIATTQIFAADPTSPVNATTTTISVGNEANYSYHEIIEFSGGEKALVTDNTSVPGQITVIREILDTTAASHTTASGITSNGFSSTPVVVLNGVEPLPPRIGGYSVGFGFKELIDPAFKPGDYTGTITLTLT